MLTWETSYAIALELKRLHSDANIEDVTLQQIYDWTLQLQEFEDDPAFAMMISFHQFIKNGLRS